MFILLFRLKFALKSSISLIFCLAWLTDEKASMTENNPCMSLIQYIHIHNTHFPLATDGLIRSIMVDNSWALCLWLSHEKSQHTGENPAFLTWSKDRSQTIHKGGQLERRDEGFVWQHKVCELERFPKERHEIPLKIGDYINYKKQLMQYFVKSPELKMKVCISITSYLFDFTSIGVVYKGKITKIKSSGQILTKLSTQI